MAQRQFAKVLRLASPGTRQYGLFSEVSKKSQEAIEKAKGAAEQLKGVKDATKAAQEAAEQLKEQAAKATSTIGEKMAQAQDLARDVAAEMLKSESAPSSKKQDEEGAGGAGAAASGASASSNENADTSSAANEEQQQQEDRRKGSGAPRSLAQKLRGFAASALEEMKTAVLPEQKSASALRGSTAKAADFQAAETAELMVAQTQEGAWQKQWREMSDKLGGHPLFQSMKGLKDTKVFEKGRDITEGLREKWETSDSAFVHRIQDATDSFFTETEQAQALREIRARDTNFDMVDFLQRIKSDVPTIIKAYLEGDEAIIKEHCSAEMIERLLGIARAQESQGLIPDPTLLDVGEVELVDLKVFEEQPIVVVQFTCQQINCVRDKFGNVVEGGPDEVHRVYYYWALQQEAEGFVGEDGKYHPPRWQLREMLIRGMHHLL